jgi:hypothetical protein
MGCRFLLILSIVTLLAVSSYVFAGTNGLVLYLPFDGNANDASGNGNNGVVKGTAKWVAGQFKNAMEFDGATYIEVADKPNSGFDNVPSLTIEVWVKMAAHHDNGIVVKLTVAGQSWPCSYNLETWSDKLAYFDINSDIGKYATSDYPLDKWFHLVGVFDGKAGADMIYIDGVLKSTNPRPEKIVPDSDLPVYIGCVVPGQNFFKGMLDDLAIYSRALSQQEIAQDMNSSMMSVDHLDKATISWGEIKSQR